MHGLTPYDTGARCQPKVWPLHAGEDNEDRYGKVDFDNDESATVTTVYVESGDDGYVLHYSGDVTLVNDDADPDEGGTP